MDEIVGARIGTDTVIDKIDFINLERTGLSGLSLGNRCFLGRSVILDLAGQITLEDWVIISPRVVILSHMSVGFKAHPLYKKFPPQTGHTYFHTGCFIGANTTITQGVTVGKKSVIAAGSVVIKNIPDQVLAAGTPAVVKKHL